MKAWLVAVSFVLAGAASANQWDFKEGSEWFGPGWYVISVDEWGSAPMIDGSALPRSKLIDAGPFDSEASCKAKLPKVPDAAKAEFTTTCERLDTKPDCKAPAWEYHCSIQSRGNKP